MIKGLGKAGAKAARAGIKERNCGAASVGVLQDNLVLSTELTL